MTNQELRNELKLIEQAKARDVWYNPATKYERGDNGVLVRPQTSFIGTSNSQPTWDEPVFDHKVYNDNMQLLKSGNTSDVYKIKTDPYIGEWKNIAHEYADRVEDYIKSGSKSSLKQAGVGMSSDFATIDILNVQAQVVNTELREFSLESAVKMVSTPSLQLEVDAYTRFNGQKDIGEGVDPILKLGSLARTSFDLPKDGAAIALTFEAQTRAVHDLYRLHVDNAISDLRRIKANKIAVELETATDVAGADWAAYSTDHSTTSPYDNIGTVTDTITANNGRVDTFASHDKVYRDFIGNTHVHGLAQGPSHDGPLSSARIVTGIPGLPGITWYIDNEKTATILTVYEKDSVYLMQGPVRTAVFRDEMKDIDAFRIFDFSLCEIIIAGRIRDITGVTA